MSKVGERIIVSVMAVLFLITSLGFSGLVIWETHQQNRKDKAATQNTNKAVDPQKKENSLQGTQLKDFTPVAKVESLQKIDKVEGTGAEVKAGDTVTAHYTGAVAATGKIFESSKDSGQPATFPLANVIKGWQEGVPGMKVGGTRRLLIPAAMAYGEQGSPPNIGPNADLVFDIELVKIGE